MRAWIAPVLILLMAGCTSRRVQYEPLNNRGRQCLEACQDKYERCSFNCFASTGCLTQCVTDRDNCQATCPDVAPVQS